MPDILPEANLKGTHGPIERRFDVDTNALETQDLAKKVDSALMRRLGHTKLKKIMINGGNITLYYRSVTDSLFKADVSVYSPKNLEGIKTVGIYVYASDESERDNAYHTILNIIFNGE